MPSKLGVFSANPTPDALEMVKTGCRIVKMMDNFGAAAQYLAINPKLIIIGRAYTPKTFFEYLVEALGNPELAAARFVVDQRSIYLLNPLIKIWEGLNEESFGAPNDAHAIEYMGLYARFEAHRLLLLNDMGLRGCYGNFSVGYPEISNGDLRMWQAFLPAINAGKAYNGILGVHEYAAPWIWWFTGSYQTDNIHNPERWAFPANFPMGHLTLRYRQVYKKVLVPNGYGDILLAVTEFGCDKAGGGEGLPAGPWKTLTEFWKTWDGRADPIDYWRGPERDPERYYAEQMIWYDTQIQQDDYVIGATTFQYGHIDDRWKDFEMAGTRVSLRLIEHVRASQFISAPTPTPTPVEEKPMTSKNLLPDGNFQAHWLDLPEGQTPPSPWRVKRSKPGDTTLPQPLRKQGAATVPAIIQRSTALTYKTVPTLPTDEQNGKPRSLLLTDVDGKPLTQVLKVFDSNESQQCEISQLLLGKPNQLVTVKLTFLTECTDKAASALEPDHLVVNLFANADFKRMNWNQMYARHDIPGNERAWNVITLDTQFDVDGMLLVGFWAAKNWYGNGVIFVSELDVLPVTSPLPVPTPVPTPAPAPVTPTPEQIQLSKDADALALYTAQLSGFANDVARQTALAAGQAAALAQKMKVSK